MIHLHLFGIIALMLIFTISFIICLLDSFVFANNSPSFYYKEVKDDYFDLVDLNSTERVNNTDRNIDILSVDYISDGKFLNATIWTYFPFDNNPPKSMKYGMLIDSDFDKHTGIKGIDNQIEIQWNETAKVWVLLAETWSSNGQQKVIKIINNYQSFYKDGGYVDIPLDLGMLHYPDKYKVTFYAEAINKTHDIIDYTKWVAIPPLELNITTSPASLVLSPDGSETIEVKISSSKGYQPLVFLNAISLSGNINANFEERYESILIPSSGIATVPLEVSIKNSSFIAPDTLLITANSSFPSEEIITTDSLEFDRYKSNNSTTQLTLALELIPSTPLIQKFGEFWNSLGPAITFFIGIMADRIAPLIYNFFKQRGLEGK